MNHASRFVAAAAVVVVLVSPVVAQASPPSHPLDEDAALALLERTLKRDRVYARRISLECVTYGTEETTDTYFQFVLREKHNAKCGGDPQTIPVVDRYAFIVRLEKSSGWNELKATGSATTRPKSGSAANLRKRPHLEAALRL